MSRRSMLRVVVACFVAQGALFSAAGAPRACSTLEQVKLVGVTITLAREIPADSFRPSDPHFRHLPRFCEVTGIIAPSADSRIAFEVWLPSSGWNGNFDGTGNGGFAGSINYGELADAIRGGFAAASTDTGHSANGTDADWALGHPQKIVDFGYRAIHLMTVDAKALAESYYGTPPRESYFASCSNGGRQALMEAQRFPDDYNGIIAGAPANAWTSLLASAAWLSQVMLKNPADYIPASKLPAISAAVLAACDARDGIKDGILNDPRRCHFNPATLLCSHGDASGCLTAPQVATLKKIYAGATNSHGQQVFPGYMPGAELGPNGWATWITGPAPEKSLQFAFATHFFADMVFDNRAWDFRTFDLASGFALANDKFAGILNATNPNLSAFKAHGGKLILYHGWEDPAIPALNTVDYYESVIRRMSEAATRAFVRLYMIPGMQHCGGGPGLTFFGASVGGARLRPQDSMFSALEHWVTRGIAPGPLIASKHSPSSPPTTGAAMTRPLCPYPEIATYKGSGSTDSAASFACTREPGFSRAAAP